MNAETKIRTVAELAALREQLRDEEKVVVQCHGCFDIVHPGHLRYLKFAREQGDVLIVSVTADEAVGKGADQPYIGQDLRLENLAAIEYVDYVCLDDSSWAGPVLEALRPDVYVKGKEYEKSTDPRFAREKALVEGYGGRVIFSSGEVVYSSTYILSRFRDRFGLEEERVRSFAQRHELTHERVTAALTSARSKRVLVVGDPIIDRYIYCDALSVAAESPILSVMPLREDLYLGAGALIAKQIEALGGEATFLTVAAPGADRDRFSGELKRAGVTFEAVSIDARPVYSKTRYLVDEAKMFKVNAGRYAPLSGAAATALVARVEERLGDHDAILVTDFGYGLCSEETAQELSAVARAKRRPLFLDVSHSPRAHLLHFLHPRLATPTEAELRIAFSDEESGLSHLASRYYAETGAEQLVITLGKRGSVIFHPPHEPGARLGSDYLPSLCMHPVDAVGAGDVFLAAATLADLAGESAACATFLGSSVAALHLGRLGNEPVDLAELEAFISARSELG